MTHPTAGDTVSLISRLLAELATPGAARGRALDELHTRGATDAQLLASSELRAALRETLAADSRTEQRRAADVIAPLAATWPALAADLRDGLTDDPRPRLRWGVAYTLARAMPLTADLWPPTRATLGLDDGDQRWAASELATRLATAFPAILAELVEMARTAPPTERKMALYSLREVARAAATTTPGDIRPGPLLRDAGLAASTCDDAGVRIAAVAALTAALAVSPHDGAAVRPAIADRLAELVVDDPAAGVRRAAAAALAEIGDATPGARAALAHAAHSDDASLARAARRRPR